MGSRLLFFRLIFFNDLIIVPQGGGSAGLGVPQHSEEERYHSYVFRSSGGMITNKAETNTVSTDNRYTGDIAPFSSVLNHRVPQYNILRCNQHFYLLVNEVMK